MRATGRRDDRFATAAGRAQHADALDEAVASWTGTLAAAEVMARLQAAGVPAAVVATPFDLLADPHLHAHDFVEIVLQPGWEPLFVEGSCFRSEHLDPAPPDPAPRQGEHTRAIATELLGVADAEVDDLLGAGVLEAAAALVDAVRGPAV